MRKIGARVYGMSACAFGLMLFAYSAGFLGNVILPKTIDSGSVVATDAAFAINALLIFLFAVQHSAMARPALRRWLAVRVSPIGAQGIYLFVTGITLSAVFLFWRPIPEVIWSVESPYLKMTLWAVCAMGWSIAILTAATVYHRQWPGMEKAAIFAPDELGRISDFQIPFF
ncbi:MAG: hypothetical protein MJA83_19640, partial [Gammaproteobacteria bacterium]|nr:hypothetical protein [Gammaproteobacteria bacterium]